MKKTLKLSEKYEAAVEKAQRKGTDSIIYVNPVEDHDFCGKFVYDTEKYYVAKVNNMGIVKVISPFGFGVFDKDDFLDKFFHVKKKSVKQ